MMEFSPQTQTLLALLEAPSSATSGLRKRQDIAILIELASRHDRADDCNDLIFHGTSALKVFFLLKKMQPADTAYPTVEAEFATEINALRDAVYRFSLLAESSIQKHWEETYLRTTSGVLRNLIDLAHDVARIKELQNTSRYVD